MVNQHKFTVKSTKTFQNNRRLCDFIKRNRTCIKLKLVLLRGMRGILGQTNMLHYIILRVENSFMSLLVAFFAKKHLK